MNETEQLEINMMAAWMQGYTPTPIRKDSADVLCCNGHDKKHKFNIFNSKEDLMDVIIFLLDNFGLSVCGTKDYYFIWDEKKQLHLKGNYTSYIEALSAMIMIASQQ